MRARLIEHEHRVDVRFQASRNAVQEQGRGGAGDGRDDQREIGATGWADNGAEVGGGEARVAQPKRTLLARSPTVPGAALRGGHGLQRFAQPYFLGGGPGLGVELQTAMPRLLLRQIQQTHDARQTGRIQRLGEAFGDHLARDRQGSFHIAVPIRIRTGKVDGLVRRQFVLPNHSGRPSSGRSLR